MRPGAADDEPAPEGDARRRCLRIDLEFDGTAYAGWQRQPDRPTVQAVVEEAIARVLGAPHAVVGAGRTDAGAHARHMVASLRTAHPVAPRVLAGALDALLPEDVGVLAVTEADPAFHARRDARWKWYRYSLLGAPWRRPLARRRTWRLLRLPPRAVLDAATSVLRGRHDFAAFANAGSPRVSTVRTLHAVRWRPQGDRLHLDVVGDGFLYKMVRTIVGTAVALAGGPGRAGLPLPAVAGEDAATRAARGMRLVLEARDRRAAGPAAPAHGLCLRAVGFGDQDAARRLPPPLRRRVESLADPSTGGRS